ncbi:polysaccharide/O-antigen polymerase [Psychroflexus torquis ATCC 700755]|uniref:Polysaccharide/O-antigen polymerase n=1 Tax=Psychroflexus torquis (strain ATCC 700755 / CIP 106069 / ACAM 623) TaxID=313595 RepID=K4IHH8_PSYTT|nr:EpsG family protein [Psychroflexus torquis]AFU68496.1 polysaccharide/O-antigen polymerase [Psychroflexus torquis ATCC 700755]
MTNNFQKGNLILLFLVSPLFGIIILLKSKSEKFITFFGTLFMGIVGSVYVYRPGSDGHSHLMNAKEEYLNLSLADFFIQTFQLLALQQVEGAKDIYMHSISYLSASVLQAPELIHVFSGFVLGYFFTKSVLLVLKNHLTTKKGAILIGFIVLFLFIRSVGALNSIRMWTGMWVFFYGTYSFALTKEKKYLFIILFSIIVHFSYVVFIIPAAFAYLLRYRKYILISVYIISFFASLSFTSIESYLPQTSLVENQTQSNVIASEADAERYSERNDKQETGSQNFYKRYGPGFYQTFNIVGLTLILLFFYLNKRADPNLISLISVGIGIYTLANFLDFSPSIQGRAKMIASLFILAAAIHLQLTLKSCNWSRKSISCLNKGLSLFLIFSIPMFLFQVSYLLENFSLFSVFLPQVSWFLGDDDFSIRTAIGIFL